MHNIYGKHTSAPAALEIKQLNSSHCRDPQSYDDVGIVLHDALDAKEKLANANVAEPVITAIMALGSKKPRLVSALIDYVCSSDTAGEIAHRYAFHKSLLSYWSRRVGLPLRQRGRRNLLVPTPKHLRILEIVRAHGRAEAARQVGLSRQRVHQIVCEWAPELKGRRLCGNLVPLPRPKRCPARKIIVSFRLSTDEWQLLQTSRSATSELSMSGFEKARAIVLNHLVSLNDDNNKPGKAAEIPVTDTSITTNVNVYS
jgi:hypothetical protein